MSYLTDAEKRIQEQLDKQKAKKDSEAAALAAKEKEEKKKRNPFLL